jgi:hypothetical protein
MRRSQRGISISVEGSPQVKQMLSRLGQNQNKASREYVTKGNRIAVREIKSEVTDHRHTTALYQSIASKIPHLAKTHIYMGIVGVKKDFKLFIRERKKGAYAGTKKANLYQIPAKYLHLLERGSWKTGPRYTSRGRYTGVMPAFHVMRDASLRVTNMCKLLASQVFKKWAHGR